MNEPMDTPLALTLPFATTRGLTLERVYREHFDWVYRKAVRLGGPGFDAEDAAQEVFLVVARRLHTFDGSSAVTTWLYGILLNVVRHVRRRARLKKLFELGAPREEAAPPALDGAEVEQARKIAWAVLDKMKAKHREAFLLAEIEGLSCEEIGAIVGCKTETVWSRLHYARKEFQKRAALRTGERR